MGGGYDGLLMLFDWGVEGWRFENIGFGGWRVEEWLVGDGRVDGCMVWLFGSGFGLNLFDWGCFLLCKCSVL